MDISLKTLLCFKKTAEVEHMTNAAKELYISQAQLSRIIRDLETALGAELFSRDGKGIRLNACGKLFYKYALQILSTADAAKRAVQDQHQHENAQLTIAANLTSHMPGLLRELKMKNPSLNFRQYAATKEEITSMLIEGHVDFAICCPPLKTLELESIHLRYEPAVVIYPEGHWLTGRESVSAFELKDEPLIGPAKGFGSRDLSDSAAEKLHFSLNYIIETVEPTQMAGFVKAGLGIALMPKPVVVNDERLKNHYVELSDSPSLDIGLVWKKDRTFTEIDRLFYDTAARYFDALNAADAP